MENEYCFPETHFGGKAKTFTVPVYNEKGERKSGIHLQKIIKPPKIAFLYVSLIATA